MSGIANESFKTLVDVTADCIFVFRPDTLGIVYANSGASEQVGYSIEELRGMTKVDLNAELDEPAFRAMISPLLDGTQGVCRFVTRHRRRDGSTLPVKITLQLLNAILGMSHLALGTDLSGRQRDYLEHIERGGQTLLRLVNDILDFSKVEAGKLELEEIDLRLDEVLANVAEVLALKAREKRLALVIEAADGIPETRSLLASALGSLSLVVVEHLCVDSALRELETCALAFVASPDAFELLLKSPWGNRVILVADHGDEAVREHPHEVVLFKPFTRSTLLTTVLTGLGQDAPTRPRGCATELPGRLGSRCRGPSRQPADHPRAPGGRWPASRHGRRRSPRSRARPRLGVVPLAGDLDGRPDAGARRLFRHGRHPR